MRRVIMAPLAAGILALAACGSASRVVAPPPRLPPKLPRAVAVALAHRSDVLATVLRRGDACEAKIQAHGLERETRLAIAAGRVPSRYRPTLLAAEKRIVDGMPTCVPPPPRTPPPPPPVVNPKPPKPKPPKQPKPPKHHHHDHAGDQG